MTKQEAIARIESAGKRLDAFVTGWGTGGTLTGAGEVMVNPIVKGGDRITLKLYGVARSMDEAVGSHERERD